MSSATLSDHSALRVSFTCHAPSAVHFVIRLSCEMSMTESLPRSSPVLLDEQAVLGQREGGDRLVHARAPRRVGVHPDHAVDAIEARRTAHGAPAFEGRETPEQLLHHRARASRQPAADGVRVAIERALDAPGRLVVRKVDLALARAEALEGPHQRVLQDGQLRRIVAGVVQHPLDEGGLDADASEQGRLLDGLAPLFAAEMRDEVLAAVERLGQTRKLRAVAQVIGPHRQDDVEAARVGVGGLDDALDQEVGFGAAVLAPLLAGKRNSSSNDR